MTSTHTLELHVSESNAIERIRTTRMHPLFRRHLRAARTVEFEGQRGMLVTPLELHSIFMPELDGYRTCSVYVGDRLMPPHAAVPELMEAWMRAYHCWHEMVPKGDKQNWETWIAGRALELNHWFLCIHPFEDGNGRTARLVMNSFRRTHDLPWHIIYEREKQEYYERIRTFEDNVFSSWYPPAKWKY